MADCRYTVGDLDVSGDNLFAPRIANQQFVSWAWNTYRFAYDWWQDGWGYDDSVNRTKPLGRTFNAIWALTYSADKVWTEQQGPNMLEWGGRWAAGQLQDYELRARCGDKVATTYGADCALGHIVNAGDCLRYENETKQSCRSWFFLWAWICFAYAWMTSSVCKLVAAVTSWVCDVLSPKHVDLQQTAYFYGKPAVGRASTFIHECRHISGKPHDASFPAGSGYGTGGGADSSWDYNGAWRWQATWLAWYAASATSSTTALRSKARDDANVIMLGAFANSPGFTF